MEATEEAADFNLKSPTNPDPVSPPMLENMAPKIGQDEVSELLRANELEKYIPLFEKHNISSDVLHLIAENDLHSMGVTALGDIKRLSSAISRALRSGLPRFRPRSPERPTAPPTPASIRNLARSNSLHEILVGEGYVDVAISQDMFFTKLLKVLIGICFFILAMMSTGLTMVWCHERVPDADKYPPLPDLVLDNLPLIPWAFKASEIFAGILLGINFLVFVFHKHRMVMIRRLPVILGILFFMRCITMMGTSLSVPGSHLECETAPHRTLDEKFYRAFEIVSGLGASVNGVKTCGDYMFSGHTIVLTVSNLFAERYTPFEWKTLHLITWVLNLFGCFMILAAHEHYTIDVVIAFFLSKSIFNGYHNTAALQTIIQDRGNKHDSGTIFFQILEFFEGDTQGVVPNEYEAPWDSIRQCTAIEELKAFFAVICPHKSKDN